MLMLGKFTCLFDYAHRLPVLGSSREPVRFHVWVSLGVAALAATGVERLGRPGVVSLRNGLVLAGVLVALSIPIMIYIYTPVWTDPKRWTTPYHLDRYRWLGRELLTATLRTGLLALLAWWIARWAVRTLDPVRRARRAAILPLLVIADLLSAHWVDVPTVDPRYWTVPPASAQRLKSYPDIGRVFGVGDKASGEPGYASEEIDFKAVRDPLEWSLPLVWHLNASNGKTPMISRRVFDFGEHAAGQHPIRPRGRHTHRHRPPSSPRLYPSAQIKRSAPRSSTCNRNALPRARLIGKPVYAENQIQAVAAVERLGAALRDQLVVEDPDRPLAVGAEVAGKARIVGETPGTRRG